MGVALRVSLGWVLNPSDPTCAVTAVPYLRQPPAATFDHACSVAVVLPVECAVTVMTRVALPVLKRNGRATPRGAAEVLVAGRGLDDVRVGATDVTRGAAAACVDDACTDVATTIERDAVGDGRAAVLDATGELLAGLELVPAIVCIGNTAGRATRPAAALLPGAAAGVS